MGRTEEPPNETPDAPDDEPSEPTNDWSHLMSAPEMRRRAEAMSESIELNAGHDATPEAAMGAFFELRVHQIELEMQNEELRRAEQEILRSRTRYQDLYDSAPVGYVTLDEGARIVEANLTSAAVLGTTREDLVGRPFTQLIFVEDQDTFYFLRHQLLESHAAQTCSLRLSKPHGDPFAVRLSASVSEGPDGVLEIRVTITPAAEGAL